MLDYTTSLQILQLNAQSLIESQRRFKLGNAIQTNSYNIISFCDRWLNDKSLNQKCFYKTTLFNDLTENKKHLTIPFVLLLLPLKTVKTVRRLKLK